MSKKTPFDHLPNQIAAAIRDRAPISRAEIARCLEISPSTVSRLVDRMIARGLVYEEGKNQEKQAGRPSTLLQINPDIASVISVDLRLTEAYVARTNLDGRILVSVTRSIDPHKASNCDPRGSIGQLLDLLHTIGQQPASAPPVRAIVLGVPSLVDPKMGFVEWAPSLGWKNLNLGQMISDEFKSVTVLVENDVNLAALGEYWKGAGRSAAQNMVLVSVGTGLGAGIILNGELFHGSTNAAGEAGYFISDLDILRDQAGKVGYLESRIGQEGTLLRASLVAQRYPASRLAEFMNRQGSALYASDIFALALDGDPAALVVFNETVDLLTIVITNLAVVLDPEMIVLGGPSDWKWASLVEAIQKRIGDALLRPIHLFPSRLGRDAVVLGAAYCAIQLESVIPDF
jgi:predicted NBD/HSP70 family sugar kinase